MNRHLITEMNICSTLSIASNAEHALKLLDQCINQENEPRSFPELIMVDLVMPKLSGFDFIERFDLKYTHLSKKARICILTSDTKMNTKIKAHGIISAAALLIKPLQPDTLLKIIEHNF